MWFPKQLQSNRKIRVRLWKLSLRFASVLCFSRSTGLQSRPAAVHLATYLTSGSNSSGLPGVRLFLHFGSFQAWILIMNSNVSLFGPKNRDEMTKTGIFGAWPILALTLWSIHAGGSHWITYFFCFLKRVRFKISKVLYKQTSKMSNLQLAWRQASPRARLRQWSLSFGSKSVAPMTGALARLAVFQYLAG